MPCPLNNDDRTLNLNLFTYHHFLQFLVWTVNHKSIEISTLNGHRSAIRSLYKNQRISLPEEFGEDIREVFSGLRRAKAHELQSGDKGFTGKRPLTFSNFEKLALDTMLMFDGGFTHLFLLLSWNLMSRSKSTETIRFEHISCENDSIVVCHKTKTSQEGTKNKDPRHCYSNPFNPQVCLFLALGIYLACNSHIERKQLFPGSKQKTWGLVDVADNKAPKDIGTHSICKEAATFVSSGSTGGPSIVSVCLRCEWSLGNVMERYFRYEAAGDQFTGRVVAGLPVNSADFAILPPHFLDPNDVTVIEMVKSMFPTLHSVPHLASVLKLALASLVYHGGFLANRLPPNHALFSTPVFTNYLACEQLNSKIACKFESQCMRASGIPPHVGVYKKLESNQTSILAIPNIILDGVRSIIEESSLASGNITRDFLEATLSNVISNLLEANKTLTPQVDHPQSQSVSTVVHSWGGGLHKLPEDFEFPSVDLAAAWRLWWLGNPAKRLPPYRTISTLDLGSTKKRNDFYNWEFLMSRMIDFYERSTGSTLRSMSTEADVLSTLFVAKGLLDSIWGSTEKGRQRRDAQLKISTLVRLLRESTEPAFSRPFKHRKRNKHQQIPPQTQ
ncbi:hypothetical protein LEN26_021403 [Aphanomyces euteiches]|nr:hypothetical protein LEN26_021403 [Aphanomyces euteiches]